MPRTAPSETPPPKFRWYQYSLRTLLVSVAVFCFLLGMNTRPHSPRMLPMHVPSPDETYRGDISVLCHDYGWPWSCKTKDDLWGEIDHFDWPGFAGDVAVGVAILVAVNVALEGALRAIWRRRSK
jgi:hypothetical protein